MKAKVMKFIKKYAPVDDEQAGVLADYALATWQPLPDQVKYLHISGGPEFGKTIVGLVMEAICQYPLVADGQCTYSSLLSELDSHSPVTLIVNEGAIPQSDLFNLLAFGWHKLYGICRMVKTETGLGLKSHNAFGYKVILDDLPFSDPGLVSKCIRVDLVQRDFIASNGGFHDDAIAINNALHNNSPEYATQYDLTIMDDFDAELYSKDRRQMTARERLQVNLANILYTSVADAKTTVGKSKTNLLEYALALAEHEGQAKTMVKMLQAELKRRQKGKKR
jgi:hypothetical protein